MASRASEITSTDFANYRAVVSGMIELCEDVIDTQDNRDFCVGVSSLSGNLENFETSDGDVEAYETFGDDLIAVMRAYSPWSAVLVDRQETQATLQQAGFVNRTRGGMESWTTDRFDIVDFSYWYELAHNITDESGGNPFNEYVFVSNGVSASAAAMVACTVSQFWKNAESTGALRKVTLVGYGGTGKADDMTLSYVPASVQGVNLEFPLIGSAAMQL